MNQMCCRHAVIAVRRKILLLSQSMRVNQMKKEYNAPEMKVFRLEQRSTLLQSSDGDKTPVIHGPIGENLVDGPDLPV